MQVDYWIFLFHPMLPCARTRIYYYCLAPHTADHPRPQSDATLLLTVGAFNLLQIGAAHLLRLDATPVVRLLRSRAPNQLQPQHSPPA